MGWDGVGWNGMPQLFGIFDLETRCYISVANQNRTGILLYMDHFWTNKGTMEYFLLSTSKGFSEQTPTLPLTCPDGD